MVKRAGKAVMIHSCGRVQELFPELIELGLDIFNPFQPEAMDPYEMKRQFGRSLTFLGGVSVQTLLPFGTPQQVRDETRRLMDEIGRDGGYHCCPVARHARRHPAGEHGGDDRDGPRGVSDASAENEERYPLPPGDGSRFLAPACHQPHFLPSSRPELRTRGGNPCLSSP